MVRLRNVRTGAIVSVRDEKVARLGTEWVPADAAPEPVAPAPKRKRTTKAATAAPTE